MKTIFYITAFALAAFAASGQEQAHVTLSNDCAAIKVPTAIYHQAIDAGVKEWLAGQCAEAV